ncbi:3-hydroxyacyl-CoA dehydrogenase NAD-binding domain-containing protein [Luteolibacter sp. LG18]|uniref:3-hydroxyacyl-CoA dehydrogenase NAD-binding domain-containing protein n=1 Tax=Luteolibacter sp. LG18 TaxID=2819286 RepID=UPI002B29F460|nr:fatty acid oxidation complex subunit alpha [Luteolibacter sp. LG18]
MPNLHLQRDGDRAILTFDREGSSANIFDAATLRELDSLIAEVENSPPWDGLLIVSAKPSIFIAGADLNAFLKASPEEFDGLIRLGQSVFNRVQRLRVPTCAAIHGACAGGGYELALACDWRIASNAKATKIGLPETQLGILPAWGGSTRLPNRIGLPKALDVILGGKLHAAEAARRKGLVDAVVPKEVLVEQAWKLIAKGKRHAAHYPFLHSPPVRAYIAKKATQTLQEKTRGNYPGATKALAVACAATSGTPEESMDRERAAILELVPLPQTRNLIRLFFLNEKAKKDQPVAATPKPIEQVAVIGAGVMGSGIAHWLASRGHPVLLQDIDDAALARGMQAIEKLLSQAVQKHVITRVEAQHTLDRITPVRGSVPLTRCDLVIEAAVEDLFIKRRVFSDLSSRVRPDCLLATNTSALPVHELAEVVDHPARLVGLHFFNPVSRMPLVEVVRAETTSDETIATAFALVRQIAKSPVLVKDRPGFLVNRILLPYLVDAGVLFENGADPEVVDKAMLDFGMPMGPLRLIDEVGLDVALHVAKTLAAAFPDRMKVPAILEAMVEKRLLGKKSGAGFYTYGGKKTAPNPDALKLRTGTTALPEGLPLRLANRMTEEASRCLDEGVAASADEIDLAMILGTGYPPFRGGPLRHRDNPITP